MHMRPDLRTSQALSTRQIFVFEQHSYGGVPNLHVDHSGACGWLALRRRIG